MGTRCECPVLQVGAAGCRGGGAGGGLGRAQDGHEHRAAAHHRGRHRHHRGGPHPAQLRQRLPRQAATRHCQWIHQASNEALSRTDAKHARQTEARAIRQEVKTVAVHKRRPVEYEKLRDMQRCGHEQEEKLAAYHCWEAASQGNAFSRSIWHVCKPSSGLDIV